ncbi:Mediator of RNA polymerase II transcription subunit 18 [Lecanora helva]
MHELLLYGQVPASRHTQVLNVLAGISAMQPQPILEKHLVFKPNRKPPASGAAAQRQGIGGSQDINVQKAGGTQQQQQQDLFYMQLVADAVEEEGGTKGERREGEEGDEGDETVMEGVEGGEQANKPIIPLNTNIDDAATTPSTSPTGKWTLQFRDLPTVARQRPITSRLINDTPITSGDPIAFMSALDYSHTSTFHLSGHRFTHLSTSLSLYRILLPTFPSNPPTTTTHIPPLATTTRPLDPSDTYILQASLRVQDASKVETVNRGMAELMGLKEMLRGCVELEAGERLAMDTRPLSSSHSSRNDSPATKPCHELKRGRRAVQPIKQQQQENPAEKAAQHRLSQREAEN